MTCFCRGSLIWDPQKVAELNSFMEMVWDYFKDLF